MAQIRSIRSGEIIPLGLSRYAQGFRLRFPVFAWVRRGYLISQDAMVSGLWTFEVCLRSERSGFAVHWGWVFKRGTIERPML